MFLRKGLAAFVCTCHCHCFWHLFRATVSINTLIQDYQATIPSIFSRKTYVQHSNVSQSLVGLILCACGLGHEESCPPHSSRTMIFCRFTQTMLASQPNTGTSQRSHEEFESGKTSVTFVFLSVSSCSVMNDIQRLIWCTQRGVWNVTYFKSTSFPRTSWCMKSMKCVQKKTKIKAFLLGRLRF